MPNDDILNALGVSTGTSVATTNPQSTALAGFGRLEAAMRKRVAEAPKLGGVQYAKFDHGQWVVGKDRASIAPGDRFLVDVAKARHGWIVYAAEGAADRGNNGVLFSAMISIAEDAPGEETLPAFAPDASIQRNYGLSLIPASGSPAEVVFETSTLGGAEAWSTLLTAITTKWMTSPGAMPVITLSSSNYVSKKNGKRVHKPVFTIVEWQLPA